jgi:hypothetical protein
VHSARRGVPNSEISLFLRAAGAPRACAFAVAGLTMGYDASVLALAEEIGQTPEVRSDMHMLAVRLLRSCACSCLLAISPAVRFD